MKSRSSAPTFGVSLTLQSHGVAGLPPWQDSRGGCRCVSLIGPGAQHFPGGKFVETGPPGGLARRDNLRRAGSPDRVPALLDRTTHKSRVARPRSPIIAPRVLPSHSGAGPPPLGRAYQGYEDRLRPSRLAPYFLHRPGTAPLWPELPLHSMTDCR